MMKKIAIVVVFIVLFFSLNQTEMLAAPFEKIQTKVEAAIKKAEGAVSEIGIRKNRERIVNARYAELAAAAKKRIPLAKRAPDLKYHEMVTVGAHNSFASLLPLTNRRYNYFYAQQDFTLAQQLQVGVRFLDFDTHEDSEGMFKKGELYLAHGGLQVDRLLRRKKNIPPLTL